MVSTDLLPLNFCHITPRCGVNTPLSSEIVVRSETFAAKLEFRIVQRKRRQLNVPIYCNVVVYILIICPPYFLKNIFHSINLSLL